MCFKRFYINKFDFQFLALNAFAGNYCNTEITDVVRLESY